MTWRGSARICRSRARCVAVSVLVQSTRSGQSKRVDGAGLVLGALVVVGGGVGLRQSSWVPDRLSFFHVNARVLWRWCMWVVVILGIAAIGVAILSG
jgi:hypothetical protein